MDVGEIYITIYIGTTHDVARDNKNKMAPHQILTQYC